MRFPEIPMYQGFQAPGRFEADIQDLEVVQGEVPSELSGAFYRVAPDPQFPPKLGTDIPLNGDGHVSMFRFHEGRVDFRCRYVRTAKFVVERNAGRALFGAYRNPYTDDPSVAGLSRGTANTNVLWHAGRMFALKEDSHPVEIDPLTLETLGSYDFSGALRSLTATAHPKVDPGTGALVFFGYAAKGEPTPDIAYYEADAAGNVVFERWFAAPYASMVHDFAVTENYVVFPIVPLVSDLVRLKQGAPYFAWDPSLPMYLGVLRRRDPDGPIRWFVGRSRFASHTMNAFEEGTKVHVDTSVGDSVVFPFFPEINGAPFDAEAATPYVSRWTVDVASQTDDFAETRLSDAPGEFPRIDERVATLPYRYGYACMDDPNPNEDEPASMAGFHFTAIGRIDHSTGQTSLHPVGAASATQEPIFVPRPGGVEEGDGYLLALVNRYHEMRSDLVILDAQRVEDEPVATINLPLRLRNGLHGTWIDGADLESYSRDRG